jgi:hypothetical protein
LSCTTAALADASVELRIVDAAGRPADGRIELRGKTTQTCTTIAARCTLKAAAGSYMLSVVPRRDRAPAPRKLEVPASGTSRVVIKLLPAATASAPKTAATRPAPARRPTLSGPSLAAASLSTKPQKPSQTDQRVTQARTPPGPNLTKGKRVAMSGRVLDAAGRPTDALLVLSSKTTKKVVGHARSVAGRFTLYDLGPGIYATKVYPRRGGPALDRTVIVTERAGQLVVKIAR